jgi:hypothetical protein
MDGTDVRREILRLPGGWRSTIDTTTALPAPVSGSFDGPAPASEDAPEARRPVCCLRDDSICTAPRDAPDRNITEDQSDVNDTTIAERARRQTDHASRLEPGDPPDNSFFGTTRLRPDTQLVHRRSG